MTVTNNRIYACRGSLLNLQMHTTAACGWTFSGNVLDASTKLQATPMSASSQVVLAFNVYGGKFTGNTIVSAAPGGSVAYLSGSHDMDWRGNSWRDAGGRSGATPPGPRWGAGATCSEAEGRAELVGQLGLKENMSGAGGREGRPPRSRFSSGRSPHEISPPAR